MNEAGNRGRDGASFSGEAKRRPEKLGQEEAPAPSPAGDARVKPEHDGGVTA
jgi:hypothetical protein